MTEAPIDQSAPFLHRLPVAIRVRLGSLTVWHWLLALAVGWYIWNFTYTSLRIHRGLGTGAYDYGLYDQGVWLLSRFEAPFVTLMGRNLFGDHTSFILVLLAPLFRAFPTAGTLFFVQSAALGLAAIPVFMVAKRLLSHDSVAFFLAIAFLANPSLGLINLENFHPDTFLPLFIGLAFYCAISDRWRAYFVFVLLALLVKEDVALVMVPLGVWVGLRRDRTMGILTVLLGGAFFVFSALVLGAFSGRAFPNAWRIPFGGISGVIAAILSRPGEVVDYLLDNHRPWYLWQLAAPWAGAFLLAPGVTATSGMVLLINLLADWPYQHQIAFHYTAAALAPLAIGAVYGLARLHRRPQQVGVAVVVLMALWTGYLWGALPYSRDLPQHWPPDHPSAVAARELVPLVPDGSVVSAGYGIEAHLSRRQGIYVFPNPFSTKWYGYGSAGAGGVEGERLPAADDVEFVVVPATMSSDDEAIWDREKSAFLLVAANEYWEVWRRG